MRLIYVNIKEVFHRYTQTTYENQYAAAHT